jgi:hypothetical protein
MRATLILADDVAGAVQRLCRERSISVSEAINELVRAGLAQQDRPAPFRRTPHDLGQRIGFDNIADTLETLDTR